MNIFKQLTPLLFGTFLLSCSSFDNKKENNGKLNISSEDTNSVTNQAISDTQKSAEFGDDQFLIDKLTEEEKQEIQLVFKDKPPTSIKNYFQKLPEGFVQDSAAQFYDFDNDGKNELIIFIFSGGIAGYSYNIFKNVESKTFEQFYSHGGSGIDIQGNKLTVFMDEFRYFFTCGACSVELPNPNFSFFDLEFRDGMFHWTQSDNKLNDEIIENLKWLKKRGPVPLSSEITDQDNGERKAYAEQLAMYFFNNQRDLVKTEKLFLDYYVNNDKKNFWPAFLKIIQSYEKENKEWVK